MTTYAASPVEAAFGNTIVSTYPSGRSTKLWLKRDGSYEGQRTNGKRTAGKWTLKGGKVCLRQNGLPLTFCSKIPAGKVGLTWASKSPKGEMRSMTVCNVRRVDVIPSRARPGWEVQ
ncbi:MAG: hypothetical protein EOO77_38700 [Oxalobacteraceae bacterium]|nr:MAG: hypothetical protein EOO77_38700 [Oxalobacteraceae bacterium]